MACWWLTEAIPLAATALVPIAVFPLAGVARVGETAAPYANHIIFLFLGGFILGLGLERWGLHRRLALHAVRAIGTEPRRLVGGFLVTSALLSMWISNTATVIMMLPIAISVLSASEPGADAAPDGRLTRPVLLGIAYGASIGGLGTLIGTPPNLILAAFVSERYGVVLDMLGWMRFGLPLVMVLLPLVWLYLTRIAYRGSPGRGREAGGREGYAGPARVGLGRPRV